MNYLYIYIVVNTGIILGIESDKNVTEEGLMRDPRCYAHNVKAKKTSLHIIVCTSSSGQCQSFL